MALLVPAVGSLLAVFCLLAGRATAMSARYVLFLFGFGLYLAIVAVLWACLFEHYSAIGYYVFDFSHAFSPFHF